MTRVSSLALDAATYQRSALHAEDLVWVEKNCYVDVWIELKKRDGTIDALYRHWVLGQDAVSRTPRWSVARDVLHWLK